VARVGGPIHFLAGTSAMRRREGGEALVDVDKVCVLKIDKDCFFDRCVRDAARFP
jgi:hypothetical protein